MKDYKNIDSDTFAIISAGCTKRLPSKATLGNLEKLSYSVFVTNCFDYSEIKTDEKLDVSSQLMIDLDRFTNPPIEYESMVPYHGDIYSIYNDTTIVISPEMDETPL